MTVGEAQTGCIKNVTEMQGSMFYFLSGLHSRSE